MPGSGPRAGFPEGRGRADPGRDLPGISPCTGPWWLSPWGEGPGRGLVPSPDKMSPKSSSPAPPPRPAFGLLPRPLPGQGQCLRYPVGSRARERQRSRFPGRRGERARIWLSRIPPGSGLWGHRHRGRGPEWGTGDGDTRETPPPGMQTPGPCETRPTISSVESAVIENRCTTPVRASGGTPGPPSTRPSPGRAP